MKQTRGKMADDPLIERILNETEGFSGCREVNAYLDSMVKENPLFEKLCSNEYKYRDYYFLAGLCFIHAGSLCILESLNKDPCLKDDPITPELIAYRLFGDNEQYCFLVDRIRGTEAGNVVPLEKARHAVSSKETERVMGILENMAEKRKYLVHDMWDRNAWFVVPSTGRLVLGRYGSIVSIREGNDIAKILQPIRNILLNTK